MALIDIHRRGHTAFNRRDWTALGALATPDLTYVDHARNMTMLGRDQWLEWVKGWVVALPDAHVGDVGYVEADGAVTAIFRASGHQTGPMGPFPPSGKPLDLRFCEVLRFDADGRIAGGEVFYDTLTLLTQLGHLRIPSQARPADRPIGV